MMNSKSLLFSLAAVALLAACGDDSEPVVGTDVGGDEPDVVEDTTPVRDIGQTDTRPVPDVVEEPDTAPDVTTDVAPQPDVTIPDTGGPTVCGNGVREQGEVCDGDDILSGATCSAIVTGAIGGELGCQANCTFDTSGCYTELCGDGAISGSEECDGALLNDTTCETLGFAPDVPDANIVCFPPDDASECTFDTSACVAQYCGNNNVEEPEICDGTDLNGVTCRSEGFFDGTVSCNEDCNGTDTSACVANVCGNGTVEGEEVCDSALFDVTCRDIALPEGLEGSGAEGSGAEGSADPGANPGFYVGGVLGCADDCGTFDTSGCIATLDELGDDRDGDFIPDADDNCPDDPNPRQLDADNDGTGNVCDDPVEYTVLIDVADTGIIDTTIAPTGDIPLLGSLPPFGASLPVEAGSASLSFDDEGGATMVAMSVTIGAVEIPVDVSGLGGGGGFPLPIPIDLSTLDLSVNIDSGTIASAAGAAGEAALLDATFEDYFAGILSSSLAPFSISSTFTIDGAAGAATAGQLDAATADVELLYDRLILGFEDDNVIIGAVTIPIDLLSLLGGGGGFPIPIPGGFGGVEANIVGMSGAIVLEIAE